MAHDGSEAAPDVEYEFDHDLGASRQARQALQPLLSDPDDPIADDVRLAASELVTNVVVHTADGGSMRAWDPKPDVPLRLEVEDHDGGTPESPHPTPPVGGRGLRIVDQLADDWGVTQTATGKVVWAEFDRTERQD
jgi:anti-sigma regulatory factor (Ser/Thr protein kinase)